MYKYVCDSIFFDKILNYQLMNLVDVDIIRVVDFLYIYKKKIKRFWIQIFLYNFLIGCVYLKWE